MLTIRTSQLATFETPLLDQFIDSLTGYVEGRWPGVVAAAGSDAALRERIGASVARARGLGFRNRGHLTTWVDWECEFGFEFYQHENWEWLKTILHYGLDPAIRVYRIENRLRVLRQRGTI
ncbi:MAG: hypothetical protein ACKV2U_23180 [Bryobacteraceae bacterium]